MYHPFERIHPEKRKVFFWPLLIVTLFIMTILNQVGAPLITASAPFGIVSYELAGNVSSVQEILASWDHNARMHAAFSLGFDYLFLVAYSTTIGLACVWVANAYKTRGFSLASLGILLAWGQGMSGLLDALENLALVLILFGPVVSPWPELAKWSAVLKFGLIFIGIVYVVLGLVAKFLGRFTIRS